MGKAVLTGQHTFNFQRSPSKRLPTAQFVPKRGRYLKQAQKLLDNVDTRERWVKQLMVSFEAPRRHPTHHAGDREIYLINILDLEITMQKFGEAQHTKLSRFVPPKSLILGLLVLAPFSSSALAQSACLLATKTNNH